MEHDILGQARVINTLNGFVLHQFVERQKEKMSEGNCLILQNDTNELQQIYIKMVNFDYVKLLNGATFVLVKYPKSTSLLFFHHHNQHIVYAISTLNSNQNLPLLLEVLAKNAVLIDYEGSQIPYQTKIKIDFHVQKVIENEVIINYNRFSRVTKGIGRFFGSISHKFDNFTNETEKAYQNRLSKVQRQSLNETNRGRWEAFKGNLSFLNEKMTETIKPVGERVKDWASSFRESYQTSENSIVKGFREFTKQTEVCINDAYNEPEQEKKSENIDNVVVEQQNGKGMLREGLTS